jgi:hypothetical protein
VKQAAFLTRTALIRIAPEITGIGIESFRFQDLRPSELNGSGRRREQLYDGPVEAYVTRHAKPKKKTWKNDQSALRRNLVSVPGSRRASHRGISSRFTCALALSIPMRRTHFWNWCARCSGRLSRCGFVLADAGDGQAVAHPCGRGRIDAAKP